MNNPLTKIMISALAVTMLLVAFMPLVSAVPASAPAPTWNQGDQWGYSSKLYLDPAETEITDSIDQAIIGMGGSVQKMVFNATMESYIYVKVTEVTADQYVLTAVFCSKMSAMADVKVKVMMEAAGTYDWATQPPMENITMQFQMDMDYLVFQSTNFTLDRTTLAIKQIESFNELSFNLDLVADNIYSSSMDGTNRVVTYEDYDVSIDVGVFLNLTLGFAPALNLYDFPLAVGEEWEANSLATLNGDLSGMIDVQGLPEGALEDISDADDEVEFPIDLSEYTGEFGEGLSMTNGTLDEVSEQVTAGLKCTGMLEVEEEGVGNGTIQIFEVSVNDGEMKFYYSPDLNFFHSVDATSTLVTDNMGDIGDDLPIEIPTDEEAMMSMEYQPASETAQKIESISGYEVDGVENDSDPDSGLPFMFVGVVIVLAALAVVAGVLMYRKLKK
jgi:hypothetical protein